jgi:putative ABC transport system permease protein
MSPLEILKFAIQNFKENKIRVFLTILGIVVGVAAITALFSIGDSLNATVAKEFDAFGKDVFFIQPQLTGADLMTTRLTKNDIKLIENTRGVKTVIPFYETIATGKRGNTHAGFFIIGLDPNKSDILFNTGYFAIEEGRAIINNDLYAFVTYKEQLDKSFDQKISLRQNIQFNGKDFKVVGFMKENSFMSSFMGGSNIAIMHEDTVKKFFEIENATEAMAMVQPGYNAEDVAFKVEEVLKEEYGEKKFMVETSESLIEQMGTILFIIQTVLSFIALISLIVGTLGIINTMVMNVNERVREIGTMKAIGATNKTIQTIFMVESLLISIAGGIIGVGIGYFTTYFITWIVTISGFEMMFVINPILIIIFIVLTTIIGVGAGTIPAKIAADLEPTVALRYE